MLKEPVAGRVKTRLGQGIGMTNAAWWFRHQSARLLRNLADPRWETRLSVAPLTSLNNRVWPAHIVRDPQTQGDLGQRMRHVFDTAPAGPVLLIGADIPSITPQIINEAFMTLNTKDCVFGPATDGGFWLAGMRRGPRPLPPRLFQNVRWSSKHALQDTLATLGDATVGYTVTLQDVDTAADLP